MSESTIIATKPEESIDVLNKAGDAGKNIYEQMAPEARDNLLRIMHGTDNEKVSKEIALEILDRAGETRHIEQRTGIQIKIGKEQVELLMATAQEVF